MDDYDMDDYDVTEILTIMFYEAKYYTLHNFYDWHIRDDYVYVSTVDLYERGFYINESMPIKFADVQEIDIELRDTYVIGIVTMNNEDIFTLYREKPHD